MPETDFTRQISAYGSRFSSETVVHRLWSIDEQCFNRTVPLRERQEFLHPRDS
jgi:hypothetical protein